MQAASVTFGAMVASTSSFIGTAVLGKTIFEKRHEYEQAHSVIESASYDGRVNNINQSRGK